jgi:lipoprotein-anchoring transpeptidase ErfK/SrfK
VGSLFTSSPSLSGFQPAPRARREVSHERRTVEALKPGRSLDRQGAVITVIDTGAAAGRGAQVAEVEVDKDKEPVKALRSVGQPHRVLSRPPSAAWKTVADRNDHDPTCRYHPDYKFRDVHSKTAFTINPGPNNPVGTFGSRFWLKVTIRGTAYPGRISTAESHGCVGLTNCDAERLASQVRKGTPVNFANSSSS